jgi:dTDP-4-dehydrorhamnose reductase
MKKILVTGSSGQLGSEIKTISLKFQNFDFVFTDVEELDICNQKKVNEFIKKGKFDFIINCAAYTAVDKAEEDQELAKKINMDAVENLAHAANKFDVTLINISTDYVFDGNNHKPYIETDLSNPDSFYGYTKREGEKSIENISAKAAIIRTSWLYSSFGNNFVKTIIKYAKVKPELKVVFDQIGTPTYARDLAKVILEMISSYSINKVEYFHYSNEGVCSWYDFAKEIIELNNIDCKILPIESKEYPTAANRPFYSVLNKSKIKNNLNIEIPHWKDSLKNCLIEINKI